MWQRWLPGQYRRKQLLKQAPPGALRDFYAQAFAERKTPLGDVELVALDFETTGLDAATDHIVSIGLVHIRRHSIRLDTAWHPLVYTSRRMPEQSAIIHQITDDALASAAHISQLMPRLLDRLRGKVLVVHHAQTEMRFLDAVCRALYHTPFYMPCVDTEALARRQLQRRQQAIKAGQLRLYNLRSHFHLPPYKAHNALYDALATAELFLAIHSEMCPQRDCRLRDVQAN